MRRPPFEKFQYLPEDIRYLPDYIIEDTPNSLVRRRFPNLQLHAFIEVKACGRDQIVKIRQPSLRVLRDMQDFFGRKVLFFIFDSHTKRVSLSASLDQLDLSINNDEFEIKYFYEGKPYIAVPTSYFEWEPAPEGA